MALPPGLLLNPATGELSGVPTVAGTFSIQLTVKDALGNKRDLTDDVTIVAYTPLAWSGDLGHLMATRASASTVTLANGLTPYFVEVYSGALPDGLVLDSATGTITGTPTTAGGYAFTLRVTDGINQTADYLLAGTIADNLTLSYSGSLAGTATAPMSLTAVRAGGTAPFVYSEVEAMPPGLSLNPDTGAITGTPTAASSAFINVTVTDAYGFTCVPATTLTFDIAARPSLSGTLPRGMVGKAYSAGFTVSDGHAPFSWFATQLPAGLACDSGTGVISGTPTASNDSLVSTARATDTYGAFATRSQIISLAPALAISGSYATNVARTSAFSFAPSVTGGWPAYTFAISAGALPTGLSLNGSTGVISGTCTAQGAFTATLRVTDADGSTATMAFNVTVAGDLSMTGTPANFGTTTVAYSDASLGHSGGQSPYSWSVSAGALPPGISLNTTTGALTGTPTTPGSYGFTVKVSDANLSFATQALTITVAAFPALSGTLPDASNGVAYSASYSVSGGHAPLAYDISAGALPAGLSLNASTGVISGTPTANGAATFTVRVTDAHGNVATRAGTVTVYALPSTSGSYANSMEVGIAYSSSISASGGKSPLAWTVSGGTLPPGLSLNGSNGQISGTPTTAGSYNFSVRVTDALGQFAQQNFIRTVAAPLALSISGVKTQLEEAIDIGTSQPVATGGVAPLTYSIGGLMPLGTLAINASTGAITGHANVGQHSSYSVDIIVTDALGASASKRWNFTVAQPVSIGGIAGNATVGVAYSFVPGTSLGWSPYAFSLSAGGVPAGTSLNGSTGAITGTPTTATTYSPTIKVTDALGGTDTTAQSITVHAFPTLTLNYPRGTVGQSYSGTVTGALGWTPYSYAYTGAAIGGLSFNASTGAITGTPSTAGTYTATTTLTDAQGNRVTKSASISIAAALAISGSYPGGKVGTAYSANVTGVGGYAPRSFAKTAGTLPTGLSLSAAGTLSGTPSAAGTFNFTVTMTDGDGDTVAKAMSVVIASAPVALNVTSTPAGDSDTQYAAIGASTTASCVFTASASGGTAPYTYSWAFVSRPVGSGSIAMTAAGTSSNKLTLSHTGTVGYDVQEVWRVTAHDSAGHTDTFDITCELVIERDSGL